MSDKFRVNSLIVVPAAVLILAVYAIMGSDMQAPASVGHTDYVKVLPYLAVLVAAICGMNVMAVLVIGIVLCAVIGMAKGSYGFFDWLGAMGQGITSMGELIIIAMMAGGMPSPDQWTRRTCASRPPYRPLSYSALWNT